MQEFYAEVKSVDRDNEVIRILSAFKLNPFEQLGVYFDATPEEIRRAYRKLSLLVHPGGPTSHSTKCAIGLCTENGWFHWGKRWFHYSC